VLTASSLLNAAYFLPILWRAWFRPPPISWPEEHIVRHGRMETHGLLLAPPLLSAGLVLVFGLLPDDVASPLNWARMIAEREYGLVSP
jgi:multicomponent Na+:H+ antiporter subunit D